MGLFTATDTVQEAIYQYLSSSTNLTELAPIFDEVPVEHAYPYIEIAGITERVDDTLGTMGREETVTLSVWSQAPGWKEVQSILDVLIQLLYDSSTEGFPELADGWEWASNIYDRADPVRLENGITRGMDCDFKFGVSRIE